MSYYQNNSLGFGGFGKGAYVPPPQAAVAPPRAPQYLDGKWICDPNTKPQSTGEVQYYCCPSGWTKSIFNDPAPCIREQDLWDCGPVPEGQQQSNLVCCKRSREWKPKDPSGADPCGAANLKPSEILAPDIIVPQNRSIITPGMLLVGGAALVLVTIFTLLMRRRK